MTHRVAIFGGGVGGMTAAHELVRVGRDKVEVTVYERNAVVGGKARSMAHQTTLAPGAVLPGEHGFRFFPGYYQHVIATMARIPYPAGGPDAVVADNLVEAPETHFARETGEAVELKNHFPRSTADLAGIVSFGGEVDIPFDRALAFARRMRAMLCACDDRRYYEFERQSWFDFVGAVDDASDQTDFKKYLADGLNQRTVAASGKQVSARTVGITLIRIMNDWLQRSSCIDRVPNGPTSDRWLTPWREHVESLGATVVLDRSLVSLDWSEEDGIRSAVVVGSDGTRQIVSADSYVVAAPLADARALFTASGMVNEVTGLHGLDPAIACPLEDNWMNGIQLYLDGPLDLAAGHTIFVDSEFSLTSISQGQFWTEDLSQYGDGKVQAILSVDISDFDRPCRDCGMRGKDMTREAIKDHVVSQVAQHVKTSYPNQTMPNVLDWHLDPAIVELPTPLPDGRRLENREALFINTHGSWANRPEAVPADEGGLENLFLASDYVRTETDLATMEGANEAGRRAARGVLSRMGEPKKVRDQVELFSFPEPWVFRAARVADDVIFNAPGPTPAPGRDEQRSRLLQWFERFGDEERPPQDPGNLPDVW